MHEFNVSNKLSNNDSFQNDLNSNLNLFTLKSKSKSFQSNSINISSFLNHQKHSPKLFENENKQNQMTQ